MGGHCTKIKRFVEAGEQVKESPEEMSRIIKKVARFLGADLVGIGKGSSQLGLFIMSSMCSRKSIIRSIFPKTPIMPSSWPLMDYELFAPPPLELPGAATGFGYSKMAFVANLMAAFLRGLDYRAIPSGNDTALSIPLAMAAGLGEGSRMGLLITEKYGPRVRLCKVFTDLPLQYDSFHTFGAIEFCKTCKKCATHCPSQAIPNGDMSTEGPNISNQSGILKSYIDAEKCFAFWGRNRMDCVNCIRVCPFNKVSGIMHDAIRAVIKRTILLNPFFTRMDSLLEYGKILPTKSFWNS